MGQPNEMVICCLQRDFLGFVMAILIWVALGET